MDSGETFDRGRESFTRTMISPIAPMTASPSDSIQPNAIRIPQVGYDRIKMVVAIGLGSNLRNPPQQIEAGLARLEDYSEIEILQVSPCFWTEAVVWRNRPDESFPAYLNGAALLLTSLSPMRLMQVLLDIESRQGRTRSHKWASRTLDLDILLWEEASINLPEVVIPHPRMAERPFVLVPLSALIPHWIVPGGMGSSPITVQELAAAIGHSGVELERPVTVKLPPAARSKHCR